MHHPDEHTLELYVLDSELSANRREQLEMHLRECHGCMYLVDEMRAFYRRTEENYREFAIPDRQPGAEMVRIHQQLAFYDDADYPRIFRPESLSGKMRFFIRRHPVMTGAGSFATLVAIAALTVFGLNDIWRDTNPAYTHLNPESAFVEVHNKHNEVLWRFPSRSIYHLSPNSYQDYSKMATVADLNGDGKNEVLTILPVDGEKEGSNILTIFSPEGKLRDEIRFREQINFRGTKYAENLGVHGLICDNFGPHGDKEIILQTDNGRSPTILYRLTSTGSVLGSYYHFGHGLITAIDVDGDGMKEIAFTGQDNLGDPDSLSHAVLAVLDPEKMIGKTEAGDSRGFGLPSSAAEKYLIRFPLSDINYALKSKASVFSIQSIRLNGIPAVQVVVGGSYRSRSDQNLTYPIFWYIFTPEMSVIEVKYEGVTTMVRRDLVDQGVLTGKIDASYLRNLGNGVLYWNGTDWQNRVTCVLHDGQKVAAR